MDDDIRGALERGGLCEITTAGARSGDPHRVELAFHALDGEFFITGRPSDRTRDWLANLRTNPEFTLHLDGVTTDLPARATEVTDPAERTDALVKIRTRSWDVPRDEVMATVADWVARAPLVRFTVRGV